MPKMIEQRVFMGSSTAYKQTATKARLAGFATAMALASACTPAFAAPASVYVPPVVTTAPTTLYAAGSSSISAGRVAVDKAGNTFFILNTGSAVSLYEIPAASPAVTNAAPIKLITGIGQYNAAAVFVDANGNLWISDGNGTASPAAGGTDYLALIEVPASTTAAIPNVSSLITAGSQTVSQIDSTHCSATTTVPCTWPNYQLNTPSSASVGINGPQIADLYVDGSGNVYYVDIYDNTSTGKTNLIAKVNLFTGTGNATVLASGLPHDYNSQITVDPSGNVYYMDGGTGVVNAVVAGALVPVGTTATLTAAQIGYANGISSDSFGNLYIFGSTAISEVPYEGTALNFLDEFGIVGGLSSTSSAVPPVMGGGVDVNGNLFYYATQPTTTATYSIQELQVNGYNFGSRTVGTYVTSTTATAPAPTLTLYFNVAEAAVSSYYPTGSPTSNTYPAYLQSFPFSGTKSFAGGTSFTAGTSGTLVMNFEPVHAGLLKGSYTPRSNGVNDTVVNLQGAGVGPQAMFLPGIPSTLFSSAAASSTVTTQVPLNGPLGLAVDTYGDVFVADYGNGKVVADCLATSTAAVAGNGTGGVTNSFCGSTGYIGSVVELSTGFTHPAAIALDGANNLYVVDSSANTVTEINGTTLASSTLVSATTTIGGTALSGPKGIAVDGYGNVFVADTGNNRIVKLHQFGATTTDNTVYLPSTLTINNTKLSNPTGLSVDAAGILSIADTNNNRIVQIAPTGATAFSITTSLASPTGIVVLPSGAFIVTNSANGVSMLNGGTVSTLSFGASAPTNPQGIALDLAGNLYVSDTGGNHVVELNVSSPTTAAYASTAQGSTSATVTTTLENSGNAALTFSAAPALDTGDKNFAILGTGTCTGTATVAVAATCTLITDFTPQTTGPLTGTATLTDNQLSFTLVTTTSNETASFNASGTQAVALAGTATAGAGQAQTITFAQPTTPVNYGAAPVTLSATASSGLTVTFSVTGPATITNGTTLTYTGAGTVTVTASQLGNTTYAAATPVTYTIVVNAASQTITFPAPTSPVAYGAAPITLSATASSGLAVSFSVTGPATLNGTTLTFTGGGTVVITASQAGNANYAAATSVQQTIIVNPAAQTITFPALPNPVIYGVSPLTLSATASSGLTVSYTVTGPATLSGTTLTITGAGTVVVTATQAGNSNYAAATPVSQTTVVNPAPQTITFAPPVSPVSYPGATPITLSASASSGLAVTFTVTGPATLSGSTLTVTGVGNIVVTALQAGSTNYAAAPGVSQTIVVTPPPGFGVTVSPNALTINPGSYGTATVTLTPTNGFNTPVQFSCTGMPAGVICSFSPGIVTPSGTAAVNSQVSVYAPVAVGKLNSLPRSLAPGTTLAALLCLIGLRKRRRLQALLLLFVGLGGLGMMTGCGNTRNTSPTTTTVTVVATSTTSTATSTGTFTLTIP